MEGGRLGGRECDCEGRERFRQAAVGAVDAAHRTTRNPYRLSSTPAPSSSQQPTTIIPCPSSAILAKKRATHQHCSSPAAGTASGARRQAAPRPRAVTVAQEGSGDGHGAARALLMLRKDFDLVPLSPSSRRGWRRGCCARRRPGCPVSRAAVRTSCVVHPKMMSVSLSEP
ncbi:hypothetical protein B0H12DRAFT_1155802 [Mycena haematopus]|nr:hypothetical protein B0H12DRAFT_1155802 [Mycena haematopus]